MSRGGPRIGCGVFILGVVLWLILVWIVIMSFLSRL